jgi:hypothetical protein
LDQEKTTYVPGTVAHRNCPLCGHREIVLVLEDGSFLPLEPGMAIAVPSPGAVILQEGSARGLAREEESEQISHALWVPEPVREDRDLRAKYGVMVDERLFTGEMSGDLYEAAYLAKLHRLIERQRDVHPAVVLDRYFTSPQLASGSPLQICEAMWRELDEIRHPVQLVRAWLQKGDEASLAEMIRPKTTETLGGEAADDEAVKKELEELSLEDFLELL